MTADDVLTLPSYRPSRGRYDELADEHGHAREAWEGLVRVFGRLGPAEIDERRRMADRLLVGEGASYARATNSFIQTHHEQLVNTIRAE